MALRMPPPPPPPPPPERRGPPRDDSDEPNLRRAIEIVLAAMAALPPDQYLQVLQVLLDLQAGSLDRDAAVNRTFALLQGHADLLNTFHTFVGPDNRSAPSVPPPPPVRGRNARHQAFELDRALRAALPEDQYEQVLQVMRDLLAGSLDRDAAVNRTSALLQGHADLMNTFHTFVGHDNRSAPSVPPPPPRRRPGWPQRIAPDPAHELERASRATLPPDQHQQLVQVMHDFRAGSLNANAAVNRTSVLLQGHEDLLRIFYTTVVPPELVPPEFRPDVHFTRARSTRKRTRDDI